MSESKDANVMQQERQKQGQQLETRQMPLPAAPLPSGPAGSEPPPSPGSRSDSSSCTGRLLARCFGCCPHTASLSAQQPQPQSQPQPRLLEEQLGSAPLPASQHVPAQNPLQSESTTAAAAASAAAAERKQLELIKPNDGARTLQLSSWSSFASFEGPLAPPVANSAEDRDSAATAPAGATHASGGSPPQQRMLGGMPQGVPAAVSAAAPEESPAAVTAAATEQSPAAVTAAATEESPAAVMAVASEESPAAVTAAAPEESPAAVTAAATEGSPAAVTAAAPEESPAAVAAVASEESATAAVEQRGEEPEGPGLRYQAATAEQDPYLLPLHGDWALTDEQERQQVEEAKRLSAAAVFQTQGQGGDQGWEQTERKLARLTEDARWEVAAINRMLRSVPTTRLEILCEPDLVEVARNCRQLQQQIERLLEVVEDEEIVDRAVEQLAALEQELKDYESLLERAGVRPPDDETEAAGGRGGTARSSPAAQAGAVRRPLQSPLPPPAAPP
ncbi:hypothetical protein PLESTB_000733900 [Pleodorina starrii]|uniref:Uncharacterized protein n=1 Tax=Pleodorina starrii TaxID=330485 RepID=A0A9W6F2L6_9CHLO|nr:hypothetical protein PLESTB_000733900 [Pleodorina starrii]GLC67189.1 hypothetical protein PLESTF_000527300 [Pleodorina starrii]